MVSAVLPLWMVLSVSAWAGDAVLRSDVRELQVGQSAWVTVDVSDANAQGAPTFAVPEGLRVQFERTESSRSTQVANGRFVTRRTTGFVYRVTALQEGDFVVGPVQIPTDEGVLSTAPLRFQVLARDAVEAERLSVEAGFDTELAWEGQVVLYRYLVRTRGRPLNLQWNLPSFDGLVPPREGEHPRRQAMVDDPAGALYVDESWVPLVVTGTGPLDQPPAVVRVAMPVAAQRASGFRDPFGMFTRSEPLVMASEPSPLSARPLPPPPPGFSGLVGEFSFESVVPRTDVAVGESVLWTVRVRGNGTLEGFALPDVPDLDGAQVYDNGPLVGAAVADGVYLAEGAFERIVVPTREGELTLPPVDVVVFSPKEGAYRTEHIAGATLTVHPGEASDAKVESFAEMVGVGPQVRAAQDVRDIWRSGGSWGWIPSWTWFLGLAGAVALPGLALVSLSTVRRAQEERARRVAKAAPTLAQRLATMPSAEPQRSAVLDEVLREAQRRSKDPTQGAAIAELLAQVGRARFGGRELDPAVLERARELVAAVEAS